MAKYLLRAKLCGRWCEGAMAEGGSKRRDAARAAVESVAWQPRLHVLTFGDTDVYGICDVPDAASATALSLLINSSGAVTLNLVPLMTVEDLDEAASRDTDVPSTRILSPQRTTCASSSCSWQRPRRALPCIR